MKLIIAIIQRQDARGLREALVQEDLRFTELSSTGGFLRQGNVTLLIGVPERHVEIVLDLVREHCHTREQAINMALPDTRMYVDPVGQAMTVQVGGAQVFVLHGEQVMGV